MDNNISRMQEDYAKLKEQVEFWKSKYYFEVCEKENISLREQISLVRKELKEIANLCSNWRESASARLLALEILQIMGAGAHKLDAATRDKLKEIDG